MKRVRAACIFQTLIFSQKPELGYTPARAESMNREELEHYKAVLTRSGTRFQIDSETVETDGSVVVHVRKQYNDRADVSEYLA